LISLASSWKLVTTCFPAFHSLAEPLNNRNNSKPS
jgi:hypothetical protein